MPLVLELKRAGGESRSSSFNYIMSLKLLWLYLGEGKRERDEIYMREESKSHIYTHIYESLM